MIHALAFTWLSLIAVLGPHEPPATPGGLAIGPAPGWKPLGPNLWFDPAQRWLIIRARVVLREGPLEHLLCLKGTKEHEAILAADAPPRQIHSGLLLTGAEPGRPVQFLPELEPLPGPTLGEAVASLVLSQGMPRIIPPAGSRIAIELIWKEAGRPSRADARAWVRDERSGEPLALNWVFAGSILIADPVTRKTVYAADEGDLITVANFASAILDLPLASSASDARRVFTANTPRIPPLGTEVLMVLRPDDRGPRKDAPRPDRPHEP